jgi:RNA polymerase sigma-70 factor (ECF subfamily)
MDAAEDGGAAVAMSDAALFDDDELASLDADVAEPLPAEAAQGRSAPVDEAKLVEWIDCIVEHDERALMSLYESTLSRVYGLVLRLVRNAALAEEVTEEVYFQVWRQAARFDPQRGRPLTWLLGMARSRAIDAIRREARFRHDELPDDAAEAPSGSLAGVGMAEAADDLLAVARGHAELHRALLLLKPQPRQLVALAFFGGLSHEEIASQTHLPLGTVKSQIRRALSSLRDILGDAGAQALLA